MSSHIDQEPPRPRTKELRFKEEKIHRDQGKKGKYQEDLG